MRLFTNEYTDFHCALDDVRATLNSWVAEGNEDAGGNTTRYALLVLQEWIANLERHATYDDRPPKIGVGVAIEDHHVYGIVRDNSEGFPLAPHLPPNLEPLDDYPEGKMGLRIIDACTRRLAYTSTGGGQHLFEFSIPPDHDPCLNMPF